MSVEETELTKVKDIIKESFNIDDDIIIQRSDKTWEEFIDIADGSSDFLHKFLSLSFIQMYHPSYPLPTFSQR
jgi:hypothetical protein